MPPDASGRDTGFVGSCHEPLPEGIESVGVNVLLDDDGSVVGFGSVRVMATWDTSEATSGSDTPEGEEVVVQADASTAATIIRAAMRVR